MPAQPTTHHAPSPRCGPPARGWVHAPAPTLTLLAIFAAVTACATVSGVQGAAPTAGLQAQLQASLPEVEQAVVRAIELNQLGVKAVTREGDSAWTVVATRGMSSWSYGELVRVRAVVRDSVTTNVWIYEQLRMSTNVAAKRDWSQTLLSDIRDQMKAARQSVPAEWVVLRDGLVTVLDVSISPGDTTPFHSHNAAVVYVPIALSVTDAQVPGGDWGAGGPEDASRLRVGTSSSDLLYANRLLVHRVANIGTGDFRALEIVNESSAGLGTPTGSIPGDVQMRSAWFDQSMLTLAAGKYTRWFSAVMPVVVVVSGTGEVTIERDNPNIAYDPPPPVTVESGGWSFIPVDARYRLKNDGTGTSNVIAVQVRQKSPTTVGAR